MIKLFIFLISFSALISCGKSNMQITESQTEDTGTTFSQAGVGFNQVKVIFEAKCLMCHNGNTHPKNWTIYETAKANLANINNRLFIVGNMPAIGSLSAEEKTTIKAWINEGGPLEALAQVANNSGGGTTVPVPIPTTTPTTPPAPTPVITEGMVVGFDLVKPIFENKCLMCHNGSTHPKNWTVYETAKANLANINNRLFVVGNMPAVGSLSTEEKAAIKAWIDAGGPLVSIGQGTTPAPGTTPPIPTDPGEFIVQNKCLGCHGSGASGLDTPLLHGQEKYYLIRQLNNFRSDYRKDLIMNSMNSIAKTLSDTDIKNIATYLSAQSPCSVQVDINPLGGNIIAGQKEAEQCFKCHTEKAPVLNGQKTGYLKKTLLNFKNLKRMNGTMNEEAEDLSDADINNVAAYFNSRRSCK